MRLYLSSFRQGGAIGRLHDLARGGNRLVLIRNAVDGIADPTYQKSDHVRETTMLEDAGFAVEHLDLRDYFGQSEELEHRLRQFDIVWVRGGNVFVLRRAMRASGFDDIILRLLKEDAIVYAGYSAGPCVLAPSLRGYEIVDDVTVEPAGYPSGIVWEGLGLLPYALLPHYKSDHPESPAIDKELQWMKEHNIPCKTLQDGEAIIVNGDEVELAS